jgi:ABC-type amino acid transport substrate-binding protein
MRVRVARHLVVGAVAWTLLGGAAQAQSNDHLEQMLDPAPKSIDDLKGRVQQLESERDRPVLLDAAQRAPAAEQLVVLERRLSRESIALALPRGDDEFRLLVDRTLGRLYRSPDFAALHASHFGAPDAAMLEFFQLVALPE